MPKLGIRVFLPENINQAIASAEKQDKPPCNDWPRTSGRTTVYRLVKKLASD